MKSVDDLCIARNLTEVADGIDGRLLPFRWAINLAVALRSLAVGFRSLAVGFRKLATVFCFLSSVAVNNCLQRPAACNAPLSIRAKCLWSS